VQLSKNGEPEAVQVMAVRELLDRGYGRSLNPTPEQGRPPVIVQIMTFGDEPSSVVIDDEPPPLPATAKPQRNGRGRYQCPAARPPRLCDTHQRWSALIVVPGGQTTTAPATTSEDGLLGLPGPWDTPLSQSEM
jgi:hypothetical protein